MRNFRFSGVFSGYKKALASLLLTSGTFSRTFTVLTLSIFTLNELLQHSVSTEFNLLLLLLPVSKQLAPDFSLAWQKH